MEWYHNAAIMGPLSAAVALWLPKVFGFLTRHKAEARALTLKEIAMRTEVLDRQNQRLLDEIESLTKRSKNLEEWRVMHEEYICALEDVMREQNLRLPVPPWATRRSSDRYPKQED